MNDGRADDLVVVLHDLSLGGTERLALRLADRWARSGRRVRLFCGDPRGPAEAWTPSGIEVVGPAQAIARKPGSRRRLAWALAAELDRRPAHGLFVPGNYHWPIIGAAAALRTERRPIIVAQLSNPIRRPDQARLRQAWATARARRRLAGADAVVTLTGLDVAACERGLGVGLARHIPPALLEDDPPPPTPPPPGPAVVLCLSRLVRQKRVDLALHAFARLEDPDVRLLVVGDGEDRGALEALALRLGVADRVRFAGVEADVRPALERCRVLLLASDFEGYGAVVVEALAAGRPVVSTERAPAAVELIDRPARGRVVPANDPAALAHGLAAVLASPGDIAACAAGLRRFRSSRAADAYLELFDQLRAGR